MALGRLEQARAAAFRLDDDAEPEALHDFRVALRRLRSTLRAWRPYLKRSAPKRLRKKLRDIQRATGEGRDAEVALDWLETQRASLRPSQRFGHDWLVRRLEERRQAGREHARSRVRRLFEEVREPLQARLEVLTLEVHLIREGRGPSFGVALAGRAREYAHETAALVTRVASAEDEATAHRARIAGKRLRYLIEPIRGRVEEADGVVKACKRLQDVLGDLHDAHVLQAELGDALEAAAAEHARRLHELTLRGDASALRREGRRNPRAGLLELTRRVQQRAEALFETLRADWIEGGIGDLVEAVEGLADRLERDARRHVEIERKYLLRALPEIGEGAEAFEVDQGWLPGERLRERLRRVRGPRGVAYFRTLKLGQGVERVEIEEPTTAEVFERLWPLTEGCRVRKRRYVVRDGGRVWEIDEFLDRPLVLAEVELPDANEQPKLPAWLAPLVEREVTDDVRFTNLSLAR